MKKDVEKSENEKEDAGASRLDTETSLAPMSSLGVVPVVLLLVEVLFPSIYRSRNSCDVVVTAESHSGESYLMVLPVLRRIH